MKTLKDKAVKDLSNNPIPNYYWEENLKQAIKDLKDSLLSPEQTTLHSSLFDWERY